MPQVRPISAGYMDAILKPEGIDLWFRRNRFVQMVRIGSMCHMTRCWPYHTRIPIHCQHRYDRHIFCKFVLGAVASVVLFFQDEVGMH
jgi:hypothetical protein